MSQEELKENILSGYYLTKTGSKYLDIDMSDVLPNNDHKDEKIKELEREVTEYENMIDEVAYIVT